MSVRALHAELTAVRALVSDGLAAAVTADVGQFWVRSACARLTSADELLVEAAGVLTAPVRTGLATLLAVPAITLAASAAQAAGLGTTGMLVVTGLVLLALLAATPWADRRLRIGVGRRRLARAGAAARMPRPEGRTGTTDRTPADTPASTRAETADRQQAAGPGRQQAAAGDPEPVGAAGRVPAGTPRLPLAGVPESLLRARVRLVSATLRQAGSGRWSTPELHHAARTDPVVRRLAAADLLLCQAVDCLERYFDDLAKGWP